MLEKFEKWTHYIDGELPAYTTEYNENALVLKKDGLESARVDYNDGRYDVSGSDLPAVEVLTSITQHHR